MRCCDRCGSVLRWTYELDSDGDGVEFLIATAHRLDGSSTTVEVVLTAPGLHESR